ncbi:hypothetical protein [Stenomitos frigidus]|uniref:Uncharacterized protein n=1 Tax=Stenomitos frigidus ULC18 TaxID=2107698 RepID=A0A2T1EDI4_9CYAN|nr:hypothetical protein [Stenomitos frigidus]PSB30761.1 hypothetical protein C7B82_08065 [Stenomitos frigidus ULC18]
MSVEYTNRRGRKHYLHEGKTKTGKPKYFFSMKAEGTLLNAIPDGYEIYEHPSAQVFLRKIPPQIITPEEVAIVQDGIKKHAKLDYFIVDVKDNQIVVYLCDQNVDALMEIALPVSSAEAARMRAALVESLSYSPMMQFVLESTQTRAFVVERWCFRGSVDDWIALDRSTDLNALVKQYGQHLGKESFYDLMP